MSSPAPRPSRVHYAWVTLGAVTFLLLASGGVRAAIGVFVKPLEAEFGWTRTNLGSVAALSVFMFGLASPFMGRVADRFGARWVLAAGVFLVAVGSVATAGVGQLWQLFATVGVIAAVGAAAGGPGVGSALVTRWFDRQRGIALGVIGAGMAAGQLLILPLAQVLLDSLGWRGAYLVMGLGLLVLVVPVALLLITNDPRERALTPLGAIGALAPPPTPAQIDAERIPVGEAVRTWPFLLLCGSFWVCGYTTFGVVLAHFIPHATDLGFDAHQAVQAMAVMGSMNVVGTIVSGWLCDRYGPKLPLALYYLLRGVSLFLLPFVTTVPGLYAFAALFGLNFISTVPATTTLTTRIYGKYSVGELSGWIYASHQLGGAIGSLASGWLFDTRGDYTAAFVAAGVWALIATVMVLLIRDEPLTRGGARPTRRVAVPA